jgi:hypothetical protein
MIQQCIPSKRPFGEAMQKQQHRPSGLAALAAIQLYAVR